MIIREPVQTAVCPTPRYNHTAVWTGEEMVIWGGGSDATGGRYDPATDSWLPTSMSGVPQRRDGHTAVWTDTEMVVWGGGAATSTGGRYCACATFQQSWTDADGDGYGDAASPATTCDGSTLPGQVANDDDCNDGAAAINPDATEMCDGLDNDCDPSPTRWRRRRACRR